MMARPSRRSTATALAFIATSVPPISPPNTTSANATLATPGASTTPRRPNEQASASTRSTGAEPCRAIR
jgi:hypothetical protein